MNAGTLTRKKNMIDKIKNVVVLMLENRSFDHMLGALPGVDGVNGERANMGDPGSPPYRQTERNNFVLPLAFDPMHEFSNVKAQIGEKRDMSGFVTDAINTAKRLQGYGNLSAGEQRALIQTVMDYFSPGSLPGLHTLAQSFAICDRWFASVPGPTWPNRFFAMMGSCHGRLLMPQGPLDVVTAVRSVAAQLGKDNIFSILGSQRHKIYTDYPVPLSALMKGANRPESMSTFYSDIENASLPAFSWIEPNFSKLIGEANSQHPPENVLRGDKLIADIYNALRGNSKIWKSTLFVVLHDEHGGFYDHVPPAPAIAADDAQTDVPFDFSYTGVRVPAVLVSPWIRPGTVKVNGVSPIYDHTSLLAFVCDQFGMTAAKPMLGKRVAAAQHFGTADIWLKKMNTATPRKITPALIPDDANETASAALHDVLPGLLSGLFAHAEAELSRRSYDGLMTANSNDAIAHQHIINGWNRGIDGRSNAEVASMIAQVQQTFSDYAVAADVLA